MTAFNHLTIVVLWFHYSIYPIKSDATLTIHADDSAIVYIATNGYTFTQIGTAGEWNIPLTYTIPESDITHSTVIKFVCTDGGAPGGFIANIKYDSIDYVTTYPITRSPYEFISASDGSTTLIHTPNGVGTWGDIAKPHIPDEAYWIWTDQGHNDVTFHFNFAQVVSGPTDAKLTMHSDDTASVYIATDGSTFSHKTHMGVAPDGWTKPWVYIIPEADITPSTVIKFSCKDGGGFGGFIANINYDSIDYVTTNPINASPYEFISASDGSTALVYTLNGGGTWGDMTYVPDVAYWIWNDQSYNNITFHFNFAQLITGAPTGSPTEGPTKSTITPSKTPTSDPTTQTMTPSKAPTSYPTHVPTNPTIVPSKAPTGNPTQSPTSRTTIPTKAPTNDPTLAPTSQTSSPSKAPTDVPTQSPTTHPTHPTTRPTFYPTTEPTIDPTTDPSADPTTEPTIDPTMNPTDNPTMEPTHDPTQDPTTDPTIDPTQDPTINPTKYPTTDPSVNPTQDPTTDPTNHPTFDPTTDPTVDPTQHPTIDPTAEPTMDPTTDPTNNPTTDPSANPTQDPTIDPTNDPTNDPSTNPTEFPSSDPTNDPTANPTNVPTDAPTSAPTRSPSTAPHSLEYAIGLSVSDEDSAMNDAYIYCILFGLPALIIAFVFIMKSTVLKDKLLSIDRVKYVSVALYFLQVFDLYSDAMFTLQLYTYYDWSKHTEYQMTTRELDEFYWLFILSLVFTIIPYCANFVSSGRIVMMITSDPIISIYSKEWFKYNSGSYSIGVLLSGGSYFTLKVINSNFLGLPQLSAGLSAKQIERFAPHKVLYNTLMENFPQMVIQFYFLWGLGLVTSIAIISLILSLFNILLSVLSTWMRRSSFAFQKEFPFTVNVSITENGEGNMNANPYRNAGRIERLSDVLTALARENMHHFSIEIMTFSRIQKSLYGVGIYKDAKVEDLKAFLDNNIEKAVLTAFECDECAFNVKCYYPLDSFTAGGDDGDRTTTKTSHCSAEP
eukprot:113088_1